MHKPSEIELSKARALSAVMDAVREIDPEMPAQTLAALITIFANPPRITMSDLQTKIGLSDASCSRVVTRLSEWEKYKTKPGKDFVSRYPNPEDRRYQLVELKPKGAEAVRRILNRMK